MVTRFFLLAVAASSLPGLPKDSRCAGTRPLSHCVRIQAAQSKLSMEDIDLEVHVLKELEVRVWETFLIGGPDHRRDGVCA